MLSSPYNEINSLQNHGEDKVTLKSIMLSSPYNEHIGEPHYIKRKVGFIGVDIFLILIGKHSLRVLAPTNYVWTKYSISYHWINAFSRFMKYSIISFSKVYVMHTVSIKSTPL